MKWLNACLLEKIISNTLDDSVSENNDATLDVSSRALAALSQAPNGEPLNNAKDHCHTVC